LIALHRWFYRIYIIEGIMRYDAKDEPVLKQITSRYWEQHHLVVFGLQVQDCIQECRLALLQAKDTDRRSTIKICYDALNDLYRHEYKQVFGRYPPRCG